MRKDELAQRLEALEATVATQAKIHVEVQRAIAAMHAAGSAMSQKSFVQQQQLSITHRKVEEMERRTADLEEMTGVLEREANDLRVDGNAHRDAIAGMSQRIDYVYQVLNQISRVLLSATKAGTSES